MLRGERTDIIPSLYCTIGLKSVYGLYTDLIEQRKVDHMIMTGVFIPFTGKTDRVHEYFRNSALGEHAQVVIDEIVIGEQPETTSNEDLFSIAKERVNSTEGNQFGMSVDETEYSIKAISDNLGEIGWDITVYLVQ